jgi:hypothetical protein
MVALPVRSPQACMVANRVSLAHWLLFPLDFESWVAVVCLLQSYIGVHLLSHFQDILSPFNEVLVAVRTRFRSVLCCSRSVSPFRISPAPVRGLLFLFRAVSSFHLFLLSTAAFLSMTVCHPSDSHSLCG